MAIHLVTDAPQGKATKSEPDCVLSLRKTFFHIHAITSWTVDTEVLHVMAPDIRAAKLQMEPIVLSYLCDGPDTTFLAEQRRFGVDLKNRLEIFLHPTPAILIHPRDVGGLGKGNPIVCLSTLYMLLKDLVNDYFVALSVMAEVLDCSKQSENLDVLNRTGVDSTLISLEEILCFAAVGKRTRRLV